MYMTTFIKSVKTDLSTELQLTHDLLQVVLARQHVDVRPDVHDEGGPRDHRDVGRHPPPHGQYLNDGVQERVRYRQVLRTRSKVGNLIKEPVQTLDITTAKTIAITHNLRA